MSLTLEIVSRHAQALGKKRAMTFGQDGGTIGRSVEADWSLPDAKRFLSGRHASIDFRSGSYYIIDTSKNGVFINDADEPVGHDKPQRLFPGDRIRIGDFEISVTIENVDDTHEALMDANHIDPVEAKLRVEAPEPTGYDLIDAHAITGAGIEMYLENDEAETLTPSSGDSGTDESVIEELSLASSADLEAPRPTATVTPVRPVSAGDQASKPPALDAFFRGAGIEPPELSPQQTEELLRQLGQVMRELIVGVIDSLHLRALQKAQLKQTTTIIEPRENNRLKFSANFEEGFGRLFLDDTEDYASPLESVRGAFADIRDHQRALLLATREALNEYLERFDPQDIEHRATSGRKNALLNAANKLRYWETYKDIYSILANRQEGELPQAFLDAFADAYRNGIETGKSDNKRPTVREAG